MFYGVTEVQSRNALHVHMTFPRLYAQSPADLNVTLDVADTVEDLEFLENYRAYVLERTGVAMIIES